MTNYVRTADEKWIKVLSEDMTHHGFTYQLGLNELKEEFNPRGSCQPGGFYVTKPQHVFEFLNYGNKLAIITIPNDAHVYEDPK